MHKLHLASEPWQCSFPASCTHDLLLIVISELSLPRTALGFSFSCMHYPVSPTVFVQRDYPFPRVQSWRPHWKLVGLYVWVYYCTLFHFYKCLFLCQRYTFRLLCNPVNLLSAVTVHIGVGLFTEAWATCQWPQPQGKMTLPLSSLGTFSSSLLSPRGSRAVGLLTSGCLPASVLASCFLVISFHHSVCWIFIM